MKFLDVGEGGVTSGHTRHRHTVIHTLTISIVSRATKCRCKCLGVSCIFCTATPYSSMYKSHPSMRFTPTIVLIFWYQVILKIETHPYFWYSILGQKGASCARVETAICFEPWLGSVFWL